MMTFYADARRFGDTILFRSAVSVAFAYSVLGCLPDAPHGGLSDAGTDGATSNLPICDADPPTLDFSSPSYGSHINTTTATLNFTVHVSPPPETGNCRYPDYDSWRYQCSLDAELPRACQPERGYDFPHLSEGSHELHVGVFQGQRQLVAESVPFEIDTTAPELSIQSPMEREVWLGAEGEFSYRVRDEHLLLPASCQIDDGPEFPCDKRFPSPELLENHPFHSFFVRAQDEAGNAASDRVTFSVDGPIVTIEAPLENAALSGALTVRFSAKKSASIKHVATFNYTCELDGRAATECESGRVYAGLTPGSHELLIKAYYPPIPFIGFSRVHFTVSP